MLLPNLFEKARNLISGKDRKPDNNVSLRKEIEGGVRVVSVDTVEDLKSVLAMMADPKMWKERKSNEWLDIYAFDKHWSAEGVEQLWDKVTALKGTKVKYNIGTDPGERKPILTSDRHGRLASKDFIDGDFSVKKDWAEAIVDRALKDKNKGVDVFVEVGHAATRALSVEIRQRLLDHNIDIDPKNIVSSPAPEKTAEDETKALKGSAVLIDIKLQLKHTEGPLQFPFSTASLSDRSYISEDEILELGRIVTKYHDRFAPTAALDALPEVCRTVMQDRVSFVLADPRLISERLPKHITLWNSIQNLVPFGCEKWMIAILQHVYRGKKIRVEFGNQPIENSRRLCEIFDHIHNRYPGALSVGDLVAHQNAVMAHDAQMNKSGSGSGSDDQIFNPNIHLGVALPASLDSIPDAVENNGNGHPSATDYLDRDALRAGLGALELLQGLTIPPGTANDAFLAFMNTYGKPKEKPADTDLMPAGNQENPANK